MTTTAESSAVPETGGASSELRAAVVGLGRAGVAHTAVLSTLPGCTLVGVADPRGAARAAVRGMGFRAKGYASVGALLERERPDVVVVCAAQHERARLVEDALQAGAAVLVERPMGRTLEEAEALARYAARHKLAVGHALAYQPVFNGALRTMGEGVIGAVRQARSSMYVSRVFARHGRHGPRLDARRVAGGVLAHFSLELLFVLVRMLGMPAEVRARASRLYGTVEDELHAMMTLPGGVEVGFDSSWSVPGYPHPSTVIELEGEHGTLLASDEAIEIELTFARAGLPAGVTRVPAADLPHPARFALEGEALWLQDAAFLRWAAGGPPPLTEARAALDVHRVMDALYRSVAVEGNTVPVKP